VTAQSVLASLFLGHDHFLYECRLRGRIEKLDDNLRTMRSVERAKAILMQTRSVSEEEAYHYLRRQAMERRVTIGSLANAIVDSQDLLG
jgi:AmiR/NasT family two-component response regulator